MPDTPTNPATTQPSVMQTAAPAVANGLFDLASGLLQNRATRKAQERSMKYQDEWAYRQREWAVQDRDFNNWYNSPAEQRKRMIAGGLNPAIMMGSAANAGVSQAVRGTPSPSVNFTPMDMSFISRGGKSSIDQYYDIRFKDAQLKQMELQNQLIAANVENKNSATQLNIDRSRLTVAQAAKVQTWLDGVKQYEQAQLGDNVQGNQLGYQATMMHLSTENQNAVYSLTLSENNRREIYTAANAEQIAERIALMKIQEAKTEAEKRQIEENIQLLKKSGVLKQIDINGQQILNKQFTGVAGNLLLGLLRRADILR